MTKRAATVGTLFVLALLLAAGEAVNRLGNYALCVNHRSHSVTSYSGDLARIKETCWDQHVRFLLP